MDWIHLNEVGASAGGRGTNEWGALLSPHEKRRFSDFVNDLKLVDPPEAISLGLAFRKIDACLALTVSCLYFLGGTFYECGTVCSSKAYIRSHAYLA